MTLRYLLIILLFGLSVSYSQSQETLKQDTIYFECDSMPEFPGGLDALFAFLRKEARTFNFEPYRYISGHGTTGRTIIRFIVEKDGTISNPKIMRSVDPYLDKCGLEIVERMPLWKPGKHNGELVRCYFTIPVSWPL